MELYIHYPFCAKKCNYCDFLSAPSSAQNRAVYMNALFNEISYMSHLYPSRQIDTIFIGGGTPSLMTPLQLRRLMETIRSGFDVSEKCEITIEANPKTLTRELCAVMKQTGINRLSLGLQSACDEELARLGRIHRFADFCDSYQMAREAGIDNINIDLMSALPGQTIQSWENTLHTVAAMKPEHISAYSLIIEEGTPFYSIYGETATPKGYSPLPSEDEDRRMYMRAKEILKDYGYERYEISNYAKAGFECRHNIGYWKREEYLGLGLGASGFADGCRYENTSDLSKYIRTFSENGNLEKDCRENMYQLSVEDAMSEFMFLGLRLTKGVEDSDFIRQFGKSFMDVYGEAIFRHIQEGLLIYIENTGRLFFTERGLDISNYVLSDFV